MLYLVDILQNLTNCKILGKIHPNATTINLQSLSCQIKHIIIPGIDNFADSYNILRKNKEITITISRTIVSLNQPVHSTVKLKCLANGSSRINSNYNAKKALNYLIINIYIFQFIGYCVVWRFKYGACRILKRLFFVLQQTLFITVIFIFTTNCGMHYIFCCQ